MSRAKRHHQVPQAYLRNFANRDGHLLVYDRVDQRLLPPQHVKNVAVESGLYTFDDEEGRPRDDFEQRALARIDGEMARLLPKLLETTPRLTSRDCGIVDLFFIVQHLRTTHMRDFINDSLDLGLRADIEMNVVGESPARLEQYIQERYPDASEEEKATLRGIAADPSQPIQPPRTFWLHAIRRAVSEYAKFLKHRDWHFVDLLEGHFLTCDNPIVLTGPMPVGLANASVIFWPLSPIRLLWRGPQGSFDGKMFADYAPAALVTQLNQATVEQAVRHIFWHPDTDPAAELDLPAGPLLSSINGLPVGPKERSYDQVRASMVRIRDGLRE